MLKIALVVLGIIIVLVAALVVWLSHGPIVFTAPLTSRLIAVAVRDEAAQNLRCKLRFTGQDKPYSVTEIHLSRELARALGASLPSGFTDEPCAAWRRVQGNRPYRGRPPCE